MVAILKTFPSMNNIVFGFKFHRSLFLSTYFTLGQHLEADEGAISRAAWSPVGSTEKVPFEFYLLNYCPLIFLCMTSLV